MTKSQQSFASLLVPGLVASAAVVLLGAKLSGGKPAKPEPAEEEDPYAGVVYMDYNATTPVYGPVLEAMLPYLRTHFGNPSSGHAFGAAPRAAIDGARRSLLRLLAQPEDDLERIIFAGCGTEADNLAIQIALKEYWDRLPGGRGPTPHIVTSNVEHPAVEEYLKSLERENRAQVTYVPVDEEGRVNSNDVIEAIRSESPSSGPTILVTVMLANNESGALQPLAEICAECEKRGVWTHTDAAQAVGKVSLDLKQIGNPDMVSIVGHKFGAPKGVAALYVSANLSSTTSTGNGVMLLGGGQEFGRRAGTENTSGIVALGKASDIVCRDLKTNAVRMGRLREELLHQLQSKLGVTNVRPNGPRNPALRLPNTLSVGIRDIQSGILLKSIGHEVAASAGATCHSHASSISSVLKAMKIPEMWARGTLRLSVGPATTQRDVERAACIIAEAVWKQWEETKKVGEK